MAALLDSCYKGAISDEMMRRGEIDYLKNLLTTLSPIFVATPSLPLSGSIESKLTPSPQLNAYLEEIEKGEGDG